MRVAGVAVRLLGPCSMLAASCGMGGDSLTLAGYAEGDWTCSVGDEGVEGAIGMSVAVTRTDDTAGRVEMTMHWPQVPGGPTDTVESGEWRLADDVLELRWDRRSLGRSEVVPASLETDEFRIRGGVDLDEADWVTVAVDRDDRAVTFEFDDPFLGTTIRASCEKA